MLLYVQAKEYMETMISLVLSTPPHWTYSRVSHDIYQYILNSFRRLRFFSPAHHTYSTRKKKQPTKMSSLSSGLFPTEVPDNINTQQFCLGAGFREKKNSLPSQPTCGALPLVYSLFRPGHESWIWLATQRWGMTSDRAGAHGSGSSGGWFQSVKIVLITNLQTGSVRNIKPFFVLVSGMSFFFVLLYLKNHEFLSV